MNLRYKSEFTVEIGQNFVGRRSSDCVIWHHSYSYFLHKTPYFAKNTWSQHRIEDVAVFYCWWVLSDCAIWETWVQRSMASLRQANMGNDMKKFFTFDSHILPWQRHIGARIIPCHCISIKRILIAIGIETVSKIVELRYREKDQKMTFISTHIIANQNSYHDDKSAWQCLTCVFCPQLIKNVRTRRCIDSSSIVAHP